MKTLACGDDFVISDHVIGYEALHRMNGRWTILLHTAIGFYEFGDFETKEEAINKAKFIFGPIYY